MQMLRPLVAFERCGLGRTTGYRRIKAGLLTRPVNLGGIAAGIPAHEIDAINAARLAGKSDAEIRELVKQLEAQRQAVAA
ncbi:MAG: transcriptional regulator [Betaproteobacteria bacterium]|nr:transcriptional regulator [Betaproteobacteria bacterium]